MALDQSGKTAILYRMVMPDHLCPYGLTSKDLLERRGFTIEDHHLETHDETEPSRRSTASTRRHRPSSPASGSAATTISASIRARGQGRGRETS